MALETKIGCCGASACTNVIAWIQIVIDAICFLGAIAIIAEYDPNSEKNEMGIADISVLTVISLLGIVMAILLLIGNNQKRVGFLKAWLIYGSVIIVFFVIGVIMYFFGNEADSVDLNDTIINVILFVFYVFSFAVVYIRTKDMSE